MSQELGHPKPKFPTFRQQVTVAFAKLHDGYEYYSGISLGYSWDPKRNIFVYNVQVGTEIHKNFPEYQLS